MQIYSPESAGNILPLKDAIVWAPAPFWDSFPAELLDKRVSIAGSHEELINIEPGRFPAIVVLDDSDIQNYVDKIWDEPTLNELIVVLPEPDAHIINLKSLSRIVHLSDQLYSFTRRENLLALKFAKQVETYWNLPKLLDAISVLSLADHQHGLASNPALKERIVHHLEILEQLIQLTATDKEGMLESDSLEIEQLREQNARLQSNNASMRLQIDALERKYNTLANSRLGRITLKRWERK